MANGPVYVNVIHGLGLSLPTQLELLPPRPSRIVGTDAAAPVLFRALTSAMYEPAGFLALPPRTARSA
jgi:hypothetical protein